MKRISAFTLTELLVAMIISSMAVMGAQAAYEFSIVGYQSYSKVNNEIADLVLFNAVLKRDIRNSVHALRTEDRLELRMTEHKSIFYRWDKTWIERESDGQRDTFRLTLQHWKLEHLLVEVDRGPLVTGVEYQAMLNGEVLNYQVFKHYSAHQKMQTNFE